MQLKGLAVGSCLVALAATVVYAAPAKVDSRKSGPSAAAVSAPDYWYVIPGDAPSASFTDLVTGIVIPSSVEPSVQTTPAGSVVTWQRPDGTRQSFVVQGVASLTFRPGPLKGTTYVPFVDARRLRYDPDFDPKSCCTCASWQDSEESVEQLSCVIGCVGCGCEGCICSPTYPCPMGPANTMTLKPNKGASPNLRFDTATAAAEVTVSGSQGVLRFRGKSLSAKAAIDGGAEITNPESITIPGRVVASSTVRGDKALFAWTSPETTVILEQPKGLPAPSIDRESSTINPGSRGATESTALRFQPLMDRCLVCGTHPNSDGDSERCECVPGTQTCTRCINFACDSPEM